MDEGEDGGGTGGEEERETDQSGKNLIKNIRAKIWNRILFLSLCLQREHAVYL